MLLALPPCGGRSMIRRSAWAIGVMMLLGATTARAEVLLTPFAGIAFGGNTERTRGSYGLGLGFLGNGVLGFEAEFNTTPDFFGDSNDNGLLTKNDVVTVMGSFLLAFPSGPVRLYAAFGGGLMKTRLESTDHLFDANSSDFGINVGGGLIGNLSNHVALRADVRYFRDLSELDAHGPLDFDIGIGNLDYWRVVGGLTFKF